jgi:ferrochelatase
MSYDGVLLIAFGGPTSPEEIRPFLARVTAGIAISPQRLEEVAHHYDAAGGKSPLNEITFRQAHALEALLQQNSLQLPVHVGFRNAAPYFADALNQMRQAGVRRALGFILSSHHTEASWERYKTNVADARRQIGAGAPEIDYCDGWHDHVLFIQTWSEAIEAAVNKIAGDARATTPLIFTAHSVPTAMATRSAYVEQLSVTARLIAARLNRSNWTIAYQSRSGRPSDPWLEPEIIQLLRDMAESGTKQVIVAPIGFVCDHVEVLYDLDIEAKKVGGDLGVNVIRASCPNDHPMFIRMIAEVIRAKLQPDAGSNISHSIE